MTDEEDPNLLASGEFDEMVDMASGLAYDEGGVVVIHKEFCDDPQDEDCPCQPIIMHPYQPISESDAQGLVN